MKLTQSGISIAKETFHFTLHEISLQLLSMYYIFNATGLRKLQLFKHSTMFLAFHMHKEHNTKAELPQWQNC